MANYQVFPGPGASKAANKRMNKSSTIKTNAAKAGIDMSGKAIAIKKENAQIRAEGKTTTVKIDSNPIKPGKTTVSPMANVRGRIAGGGLGGLFGMKNR
jgi:hypothetical protein